MASGAAITTSKKATQELRPLGNAPVLGALFIVVSCLLFPLGNASVKHLGLGVGFSVAILVWARYAGQMVSVFLLFSAGRGWGLFRTRAPKLQLLRSALLLGTTASFFAAAQKIPLGTATAINFAYPCLLTVLAALVLKEKVGWRRWTAVCVCFGGALLIVRPWGLLELEAGGEDALLGRVYATMTAVSYALYQLTSKAALRYDDPVVTNAYTALVGTVVMTAIAPVFVIADTSFVFRALWSDWVLFGGVGLLFGVGHFFVAKALDAADASFVAPASYIHVGTSAFAGWVFFGEVLDGASGLGALVIVTSGSYIAWRESRGKKRGSVAVSGGGAGAGVTTPVRVRGGKRR